MKKATLSSATFTVDQLSLATKRIYSGLVLKVKTIRIPSLIIWLLELSQFNSNGV